MISPQQYRKLMKQFQLENHIGRSAIKVGIDPKTAIKYIKGAAGPDEQPGERCWRTHPDAFAEVWPGVEEMLVSSGGVVAESSPMPSRERYIALARQISEDRCQDSVRSRKVGTGKAGVGC